jgi:hypothetical protein
MSHQRTNYYVISFPLEDQEGKEVSIELSEELGRSERVMGHYAWLYLSQQGYDICPLSVRVERVEREEGE